jgi:hypothetical protein
VSGNVAGRAWRRLRSPFYKPPGQAQAVAIPEEGAARLLADKSYFRVSLRKVSLAADRSWGTDRVPAVSVSVRVLFSKPNRLVTGRPSAEMQTFAILVRPSATSGSGVYEDYRITDWLPYQGQSIEIEAALYAVLGKNKLVTAIDVISDFASLVTPPVSAALTIADKVATGIEKVVKANGTTPKLHAHKGVTAPGWIAVVNAPEDEAPRSELRIDKDERLLLNGRQLSGHDYLVLRVESCRERDDWRAPDLNQVIAAALYARDVEGDDARYRRLREEALGKVYLSTDFTSVQAKKAAVAVMEKLDDVEAGAVDTGGATLAEIVARRGLPSDSQVESITLDELIAGRPFHGE